MAQSIWKKKIDFINVISYFRQSSAENIIHDSNEVRKTLTHLVQKTSHRLACSVWSFFSHTLHSQLVICCLWYVQSTPNRNNVIQNTNFYYNKQLTTTSRSECASIFVFYKFFWLSSSKKKWKVNSMFVHFLLVPLCT